MHRNRRWQSMTMSFLLALHREEQLSEGIQRVLREQVQGIQDAISHPEDLKTTIHHTRKHVKMIRSILRLLRVKYGNSWFAEENIFFRDLAAQLSDIRDAHVLEDSIDLLQHDATSGLTSFNTGELRTHIQSYVAQLEQAIHQSNTLPAIGSELETYSIPGVISTLDNDLYELIDGLERIYEAGYNNMYQTYLHPAAESFHEWRKSVKHLLYVSQLLENYWPITTAPTPSNLKELSDVLGQEHDLSNLQLYVTTLADDGVIENATLDLFVTESDKKRTKLQRTAEHLGKEVYTETAEYFIRHFQHSWSEYKLGA